MTTTIGEVPRFLNCGLTDMQGHTTSLQARRCRRKFLRLFPQGFRDEQYLDWERNYKWNAHLEWEVELNPVAYRSLLLAGKYREIAARAVRIESRTNLLFSFEKMALRDAVKSLRGAQVFSEGLFAFLHGPGTPAERFEGWCAVVARLPRKQTRVDLAGSDGVRIHGTAQDPYLSQTERNACGRSVLW